MKNEEIDLFDLLRTAAGALLFLIVPLFAPRGYEQLGEYKAVAFLLTGSILSVLLIGAAIAGKRVKELFFRTSMSGWFAFYFACLAVSSIYSVNTGIAVLGEIGWRVGLIFELICLILCLGFTGVLRWKEDMRNLLLAGGTIVIILGILNRFEIYPFPFMRAGNGLFISRVGQINWYCSFLSVILPYAIGELYLEKQQESRVKIENFLYIFCFLGFWGSILQGSDSAFLFVGAMFAVMLLMAWGSRKKMINVLEIWDLFIIACLCTSVIIHAAPEMLSAAFTEKADLAMTILNGRIVYLICILSLAATVFLRASDKGRSADSRQVSTVAGWKAAVTIGGVIGISLLLLIIQLCFTELIPDEFGSGRGTLWHYCAQCWNTLPAGRKLIGVGPDCLKEYSTRYTEYGAQIHRYYGDAMACAHSILLNRVLTTGILGCFSYVALITEALKRMLKQEKALPFAMAVIGYYVNGLVSFDNIMNMPYAFLLTGAGLFIYFREERH